MITRSAVQSSTWVSGTWCRTHRWMNRISASRLGSARRSVHQPHGHASRVASTVIMVQPNLKPGLVASSSRVTTCRPT
jgi:hypothetical protein